MYNNDYLYHSLDVNQKRMHFACYLLLKVDTIITVYKNSNEALYEISFFNLYPRVYG